MNKKRIGKIMKIGDNIKFKFNNKWYEGLFLEEQLAMFPEADVMNEDQIKIEIKDPDIRKELSLGRKKCIIIDKSNTTYQDSIVINKKFKI